MLSGDHNHVLHFTNKCFHCLPSSNKSNINNNSKQEKQNKRIHQRNYTNLSCFQSFMLLFLILLQFFIHKTIALINAELTTTSINNNNNNFTRCKENMSMRCFNDTAIKINNNTNLLEAATTTMKTSINVNVALLDGSAILNSNNNNDQRALDFENLTDENVSEYIFDRTDVRIIFITLYTIVFCCCFFGNLLVILVVTMSRRLRSITNFFLANLALADFCVGLFCVMQNLSIYLIDSWVFGEFLCRMYQFVHSLSYTASIFILVVICMERYFAIVHPITCKQILTAARLRIVILTVWITSAVYSTPKFVFSKTIKNIHMKDGSEEEICVLDRKMFNSQTLDIINFVLLYIIPLLVMTVLYSKIAIALWRSSHGLTYHLAQHQHKNSMNLHKSMNHNQHQQHYKHGHTHSSFHNNNKQIQENQKQKQQQQQNHEQQDSGQHELNKTAKAAAAAVAVATTTTSTTTTMTTTISNCNITTGILAVGGGLLKRKQSSKYKKRNVSISESEVSLDSDRPTVSTCRRTSFYHSHQHYHHHCPRVGKDVAHTGNSAGGKCAQRIGGSAAHMSNSSSNNVLRARRGVVRMLIIFVLTFALCNLPYHARKMWQYWSRSYRGDSNFIALVTPLTFLVSYFNSGINPLLYAFLSRNFRKGMKELLLCSWKKTKGKSSQNSNVNQQRMALQTYSLPTDTTHIGNDQL